MAVEVQAPPTRRFVAVPSLALLVLHIAGGWFAISTVRGAWDLRMLLQILYAWGAWLMLGFVALVPVLSILHARAALYRILHKEPQPDPGLHLRVAVFIGLACITANVYLFSIRFDLMADFGLTAAYAFFALWSLLLPKLRSVTPRPVRRTLDIVFTNAAVLLILAEIGLRIMSVALPSPLLTTRSSSQGVRLRADRSPAGQLRFDFPINEGGHYDSEFAPRSSLTGPLVTSIGDSFSYGMVPHAFHFTTIAEENLPGVEIYNMGFPGIGPTDYRYLLEHEALPLQPDLVVVQLFLGNDITDSPDFAGPPRWYQAEHYMVPVVVRRLGVLWRARANALPASSTAPNPELTREQLMMRHPWLADPLTEKPTFTRDLFLDVEVQQAKAITGPDEQIYERFFTELEELEKTAGAVRLAYVLIPDEFQVEDAVWDEVTKKAAMPLDRDRPQRKVTEWLKARGRPVLDLLPILRAVEPLKDGRKHLFHLQDTHFNARGNNVEGHALAGFIKGLLPQPEAIREGEALTLRYNNRARKPVALNGGFTLTLDVQGAEAIVKQVRAAAPILSIQQMQVSGEGARVITADSAGAEIQVAFRKAVVEGTYQNKPFRFDFDQANRPVNLERDPLQTIAWAYSLSGRKYKRGPAGEFATGDEKNDAQGEALGIILDAPIRLPGHPVRVGDKWTSDWKGLRSDPETRGIFQYKEAATLEEIDLSGPPRARISFTTTGVLEIPQDRNASRGEKTTFDAQGTLTLDLQSGTVVASDSSGTITSAFSAGFKIIRTIKAKYEER